MKKFIFIALALLLFIYLVYLSRRQAAQEPQGPVSMEELEVLISRTDTPVQAQVDTSISPQGEAVTAPKPPISPEPFKPSNQQIQAALKAAGYYKGLIDGKIGPLTEKAIRDFQRANGLAVDGKVGRKTWGVLSKYLDR